MSELPPTSEIPTLSTSLLGHVRSLEPLAWSRLVLTYGPVIYRWCRRAGVREVDAADVVQDVFMTVAREIVRFERQKQVGSFRAWLATITRSRIHDFLRRDRRHPAATGGSDILEHLHQIPNDAERALTEEQTDGMSLADFESSLARQVMTIMQSEFEEGTWRAFVMTTLEGLSPAIVAERLQVSLASVYQARSRVLRRIRQRLAED